MTQSMELILVIDDDRDLCELLVEYLTREGFWVETAHDGEKGIKKALTGTYGVVVLDVMLPDINGKEVCQRVRNDKTMNDVRIICISGMVEEDKVSELREAGANDFMHKPFEVEKLVDRMCHHLDIEAVHSS